MSSERETTSSTPAADRSLLVVVGIPSACREYGIGNICTCHVPGYELEGFGIPAMPSCRMSRLPTGTGFTSIPNNDRQEPAA